MQPASRFCALREAGALFEKSHLHPAKTLTVSVCVDGDDVFSTAQNIDTTVTHRHAVQMQDLPCAHRDSVCSDNGFHTH